MSDTAIFPGLKPVDVSEVPGAIPPEVTIDDDPNVEGLRKAMAGEGNNTPPGSTSHMPASVKAPEPISDDGPQDDDAGPGPDARAPDEIEQPSTDWERVASDATEDDPEEILEPRVLPVPRTLTDAREEAQGGPRSRTYVQKGLSFFGKIELYGTFGRAIDIAMSGDNALGVDDLTAAMDPKSLLEMFNSQNELPGAETSPDNETADESEINQIGMQQAGKVLSTFVRILSISPDLLKDVYCIILAVPKGHRKWAIDWALDEMPDEVGEDIIHVFIDQNWPVMEDFYRRRLPKMLLRAKQARRRFRSDQ